MMYSNKLAVAIKHKNKVLREDEDKVYLPFGAEYSIFVKNLNTARAKVSISIDGNDIANGDDFLVGGNSELNIERFVKDNNVGNSLKFIERNQAVEDARGIEATDGLIRIEFAFEKKVPRYDGWRQTQQYPYQPQITWTSTNTNFYCHATRRTKSCDFTLTGSESDSTNFIEYDSNQVKSNNETQDSDISAQYSCDVGITVPGSINEQQFVKVPTIVTEVETYVIVLQLIGQSGGKPVKQAITTKTKPKCVTCETTNKATAKFCSQCGTGLEII